jgi:hypothetical protein
MQAGEIYVVKTSGEKVIILGKNEDQPALIGDWFNVRRPVATDKDGLRHETNKFLEFELETLQEHADRQVAEAGVKAKAQMALIRLERTLEAEETKTQDDIEIAQAGPMLVAGKKKKHDPSVN